MAENSNIHIEDNKELNIWEALIPVIFLVIPLFINNAILGGEMLGQYSNHYILLFGALVAAIVGLYNRTTFRQMGSEVWENLRSVFIPILILFLVGALAASWLISGVIPAMVYYGLQVLKPSVFLPATLIISVIVSLATGSSWTTSATVGIALIGIALALGIHPGMAAGAILSGAYFGDKMSPLSDTTNLAPAMAGTDLYTHIRYMMNTTLPTIIVTLIIFIILNFTAETQGDADMASILTNLKNTFTINYWLFLVPVSVIILVIFKIKPLIALSLGVIFGVIFAFIFQGNILNQISGNQLGSAIQSIFVGVEIPTDHESLTDLYIGKGMKGMLWTIYLIISAMTFGGVMDAIGALSRITKSALSMAKSVFGLFASTALSCIGLNIIASDQYLAIVIPGKMYKDAFHDKDLAPENLSRTLEDSGTVTSVLIPWNTCGAYHSSVLNVSVGQYFMYAIFNWLSPIMTLIIAGLGIKIRSLAQTGEK